MTKILIGILSFLLWIFPKSGILLAPYQSLTFPGEKVISERIINAIETRNIDALEAMMSKNLRKSVTNLSGEISMLVDLIDGEITNYSWRGSSSSDESNLGARISRKSWTIEFNTTTDSYRMNIGWVLVNNRRPEEVGMYFMILRDSDRNLLKEIPAAKA